MQPLVGRLKHIMIQLAVFGLLTDPRPTSPSTAAPTASPTPVATVTPVPAMLKVGPKSIRFGTRAFATSGEQSPAATVKVTNPGGGATVPVTFGVPTVSNGFILTSNGCTGQLAPGSSCEVEIAFKPSSLGTRAGTLQLNSNAANNPNSIKLKGKGVAPPLKYQPKKIRFGRLPAGTTSPPASITLTNSAAVSITIATVAATPPFNLSANTCTTLGPGATCTVAVEFAPSTPGKFKGTLEITEVGAESPQHVTLLGVAR